MKQEKTIDDYVYISIICALFILVALYFLYIICGKPDIFHCLIYDTLGIYCPGCGCTRAFICLMHGSFLSSLYYNPTVLYSAVMIFTYLITQTIGRITGHKNSKYVMKYDVIYIYIGIILLITTCIVKNFLLFHNI